MGVCVRRRNSGLGTVRGCWERPKPSHPRAARAAIFAPKSIKIDRASFLELRDGGFGLQSASPTESARGRTQKVPNKHTETFKNSISAIYPPGGDRQHGSDAPELQKMIPESPPKVKSYAWTLVRGEDRRSVLLSSTRTVRPTPPATGSTVGLRLKDTKSRSQE